MVGKRPQGAVASEPLIRLRGTAQIAMLTGIAMNSSWAMSFGSSRMIVRSFGARWWARCPFAAGGSIRRPRNSNGRMWSR